MTLRQALGETHLQGWGAEDWAIRKMAVTKKEDGNAGTPEGSRAGLLFRGSLCCCSPHSRAPASSGWAAGADRASRNFSPDRWDHPPEINVNRESDHTPKGTRESHQCLASFVFSRNNKNLPL